ncbi:MAG: toll/interleukin-1 receptor domain-containing protein, partial [Pseudomonadota bacterium]|nr:toll/interleukin-1 receptor domain-containing protein [Pseudomonadota bacterium]
MFKERADRRAVKLRRVVPKKHAKKQLLVLLPQRLGSILGEKRQYQCRTPFDGIDQPLPEFSLDRDHMPTIFLSHSSKDKPAVKALAEALLGHGFKVWLDEWDLEVGDSIVQNIQDGLQRCEFVAVWLTESSINSGWAAKEWQSKVFSEVSTKKISVLPLLAEDCDVPFFLSDKKYADFRTSFDHG